MSVRPVMLFLWALLASCAANQESGFVTVPWQPANVGDAGTAARAYHDSGAEIHIPTHENEVVYRALDIEGEKSVPVRADECGTRHRAAYRLTRDCPECMVTVVSQDGSVRYVGNRNGKVTFWDTLSI